MKPMIRKYSPVALLACVLVLAFMVRAGDCASLKDRFTLAWKHFHALADNPQKAKYRSNWEANANEFTKVFKADPRGTYAPKSLYYLGRVYEELGIRSGSSKDLQRSCDYYGRVASRFPKHRWTDDCLYRRGLIRLGKLGEPDLAYSDFLTIVHRYSKSDMAPKARAKLKQMDKSRAKTRAVSKPIAVKRKKEVKKSLQATGDPSIKAHLNRIRYKSSKDYTRVVLDLDEEARYKYNVLAPDSRVGRPHRLYIDLENTVLDKGAGKELVISDGILKRIRSGQHAPDKARVVLDFEEMQDYKVFPLDNPFRIVVDVFSGNGHVASAAKPRSPGAKGYGKPPKYKPSKQSKAMVGDLVEQLGLTIKTIMIDPGHGGKDPGATKKGVYEKNINLRFAKILGGMLKKKGFKVIYTRTSDKFIPLDERTALANMQKADMFISIHCNAHRSSNVHGLETYSLNLAKTKDAVRVAARENAISPKRISDLQVILTDLMLNSKMRESQDLAKKVQSSILKKNRSRYGIKNNGVREAPFYVLMGAKMPSILVELGYLTNRVERHRLQTDKYLRSLAQGLVIGIVAYKRQIERFASL